MLIGLIDSKFVGATKAAAIVACVALIAASPAWAGKRSKPNDELTEFNTNASDRAQDVAVLRAMQRTHDAEGKPLRRVPGIRILKIRVAGDEARPPPLKSQHVRLKPGKYYIEYACGLGTSTVESVAEYDFASGRQYYIYCESRNLNHYDVKFLQLP